MPEQSKKLKTMLQRHVSRAWEAEMKDALGGLAAKFDEWKAGTMSSADLHAAIHDYHDGIAREIWKRFSTNSPKLQIAHAVAVGLVTKESLPPEVLEQIATLVECIQEQERGE